MNKFLASKKYSPHMPQKYWCTCCDNAIVDSEIPVTGSFFIVGGSGYSQQAKDYLDTNWQRVMFAVCFDCLVFESEPESK